MDRLPPEARPRILVLDSDVGAACAVVQSLGAGGYQVCLAGPQRGSPAFASRYVAEAVLYPDPAFDKEAFKGWLEGFQAERRFALVVPVTERTLVPLHESRASSALAGGLALPEGRSLEAVLDKAALEARARSLGIPLPESLRVQDLQELRDPRIDLWLTAGPVVVKTVRSKNWRDGRLHELPVLVASSRAELESAVQARLPLGPVLVQRWVPGRGIGIEVLAQRGEIVMLFAHERLHEYPLTGGGSSYRRSIEPPPPLVAHTARLLRSLSWHGVAMAEFRAVPSMDDFWLMEVNPRLWGSLPLALFAGADFPRALVEMLLNDKAPSPAKPRLGVRARSFRRDVTWTKAMLAQKSSPSLNVQDQPLWTSLLEWGRILTGRETWDNARLGDPRPILLEVRQTLSDEFGFAVRWAKERGVRAWARFATRRRLRSLRAPERVLVLCHGNVCRSPYAAARLAAAVGADEAEVRSAGFVPRPGRTAPEAFLSVAARRGVDLSQNRSCTLLAADLSWATLVVIMDRQNFHFLRERSPSHAASALWLAVFAGDQHPEIADPYGASEEEIGRILDRIDASVQALAKALRASRAVRSMAESG